MLYVCVGFLHISPELSNAVLTQFSKVDRMLHHSKKMCFLMIAVGLKEQSVLMKRAAG